MEVKKKVSDDFVQSCTNLNINLILISAEFQTLTQPEPFIFASVWFIDNMH